MSIKEAETETGNKLKELRSSRGLSLRALAELSGVTLGALSQVENGKTSPSISTLKKILSALGSTLGEFFASQEPTNEDSFIFRSSELINVSATAGLKYKSLPTSKEDRQLQLLVESYAPGTGTGDEPYSHAGEECGYCMEGTIELIVDGHREVLGAGDTFYFKSTQPHSWKNIGNSTAKMITCCTPATF